MQVLVVCDHSLIGQSLVAMLRHHSNSMPWDATLCGAAEAIARARELHADAILVDATNDFATGLGTIRALAGALPEIGIIALGPTDDDGAVLAAVSAGGDGYLAWDAGEDALVATLRAVLDGELGVSGRAARSVVRELRRAAKLHTTRAEVSAALTMREQEVFDLVRQGTRSHDIAELLCIADATVYKHIQNILDKLHVRSRAQAIMLAELDAPDPPPNGRH